MLVWFLFFLHMCLTCFLNKLAWCLQANVFSQLWHVQKLLSRPLICPATALSCPLCSACRVVCKVLCENVSKMHVNVCSEPSEYAPTLMHEAYLRLIHIYLRHMHACWPAAVPLQVIIHSPFLMWSSTGSATACCVCKQLAFLLLTFTVKPRVCGGSAEKSRGRSSKTLPKLSEVANTHTDTLSSCHWRYWLGNQVLSRIILTFALLLLLTPQTYRILHHRENYGRSKLALTFSHCNM